MNRESNMEEQRNNSTPGNNPNDELFQHGANSSSPNTPANAEETFNQQTPRQNNNNTRIVVESPINNNAIKTININIPDYLVETVQTLIKNDPRNDESRDSRTDKLMAAKTIVPIGILKTKLQLPSEPSIKDYDELLSNTDLLHPNRMTGSTWAAINAYNAPKYKIPSKVFPGTYYESARFNSDTWKKFVSQLTPMPYPVSSLSEVIHFIEWYNDFTYVAHQNGIHQLLYYTCFSNIKNPSAIEKAENKELMTTILPKIFPHRLKKLSHGKCSSTIFKDQIKAVLPIEPLTIATKLLEKYIITTTTTIADIKDQIGIMQSLRYCAGKKTLPDDEIIPHLKMKISNCYGGQVRDLLKKWNNISDLTMNQLLDDLQESINVDLKYQISTNTRTDPFLPRNFQINNINRYNNTRYLKRRYTNKYLNRNRNFSRNNHITSQNYTKHQS